MRPGCVTLTEEIPMFPHDPPQAPGPGSERASLCDRLGLYFRLRHEDPLARLRVRVLLARLRLTQRGAVMSRGRSRLP
jgi:hypothetical protein